MGKAKTAQKLNPQQELFCREYIVDLNGTQAALRAGYGKSKDGTQDPKAASVQAARLLGNDSVMLKISELAALRNGRVEVKGDDVLRELQYVGHSDIRRLYNQDGTIKHPTEWPEDLARAVASIEVEETFERDGKAMIWTGYTKKVKFWNKPQGLDKLGKHKELFSEKDKASKTSLEDLVVSSTEDLDKPKEDS